MHSDIPFSSDASLFGSIKVKEISFSYHVEKVFAVDIPALQHGNDGLIYTCVNSPYTPGSDANMCNLSDTVPQSHSDIYLLIADSSGNLLRRTPSTSNWSSVSPHYHLSHRNPISMQNQYLNYMCGAAT